MRCCVALLLLLCEENRAVSFELVCYFISIHLSSGIDIKTVAAHTMFLALVYSNIDPHNH